MLKEERLSKILNILENKNSSEACVKIVELVEALNVSSSTVRRDLDDLETTGHVKRTHGGAILAKSINTQYNFENKILENFSIKDKIAKYAASLIQDGDTIAINSSTLTYLIIDHIVAKNVTVVTNSIELAYKANENINFDIILLGGVYVPKARTIEGSITMEQINNMYFDKSFLGANGVDINQGITTAGPIEVGSKKAMISASKESYFLCESNKFDNISFYRIANLNEVTGIITDSAISSDQVSRFEELIDLKIIDI